MAEIILNSNICYYNSGTNAVSGVGTSVRQSSPTDAIQVAESNAVNSANNIGVGVPNSGGQSSTASLKFGSDSGVAKPTIGTPSYTQVDNYFNGSCTYDSIRTSTMYQLKLSFTIPTGLNANNVRSATLNFSATNINSSVQTFHICAPKTTSNQTKYYKYSEAGNIIDKNQRVTFSSPNSKTTQTYSKNITDIFKQCITNGQGWITILEPTDYPNGTHCMTLSGTPKIIYEENYSACTAPTSITFARTISSGGSQIAPGNIVEPGGSLTISWSGAGSGTNNNITGYDVYYRIGGKPTTSSYSGHTTVTTNTTSGSCAFTISSSSENRGKVFYAMIRTKGSAGSSYYSNWKEGNGGKINQLPNSPAVNVDKTRIISTASSENEQPVKFTVKAGTDNDAGQNITIYYATSKNGTKIRFNSPLTANLQGAATYYFWTFDGLEYSAPRSQTIRLNVPPTVGGITMKKNKDAISYQPTTTVNNVVRSYIRYIDGQVNNVKGDEEAAFLNYQWKISIGNTADADINSFNIENEINFNTEKLSNIDVTKNGVKFNNAYRLGLVVTDDLGESSTIVYSSQVFAIPPAPIIQEIYNHKGSDTYSGTNQYHFEKTLRFYYNNNNTGLTRTLEYHTSYKDWPEKPNTISLNYSYDSDYGYYYSDAAVSGLGRGVLYYFRIKYSFGNATIYSTFAQGYYYSSSYFNVSRSYRRAYDITPKNLTITPSSGSTIKPYTQGTLSFTFEEDSLPGWSNTYDVANNYNGIYSIKLKYPGGEDIPVTSSGNRSGNTVNGAVTLNNITTNQWKDLLKLSNAPNKSYSSITLEVTATNNFGVDDFKATKTFTANFIEGIFTIGTPELRIKTGTSTYTKIPDSYNYIENQSGKDVSNRYHIFEGQTLQLSLSGLKCYANQKATIYFMNGDTPLKKVEVAESDWTESYASGTSYRWTLSSPKIINYVVPANTVATYASNVRDYSVKVVLDNGKSKLSTDENNGNLNTCFHTRFAPSSINFKITTVTENSWTWSCSNWGSLTSSTNYSADYSSVKVQARTSTSSTSGYSNLGSQQTLTSEDLASGSKTIAQSLDNIGGDILYFGAKINVVLNFQTIDDNGTTRTPSGTKSYSYTYNGLYTLYRATPNLLYGKNFFALNANSPLPGKTDQILELHNTGNGTNAVRNKIYFNDANTYFYLNGSNLEIDCGSW